MLSLVFDGEDQRLVCAGSVFVGGGTNRGREGSAGVAGIPGPFDVVW